MRYTSAAQPKRKRHAAVAVPTESDGHAPSARGDMRDGVRGHVADAADVIKGKKAAVDVIKGKIAAADVIAVKEAGGRRKGQRKYAAELKEAKEEADVSDENDGSVEKKKQEQKRGGAKKSKSGSKSKRRKKSAGQDPVSFGAFTQGERRSPTVFCFRLCLCLSLSLSDCPTCLSLRLSLSLSLPLSLSPSLPPSL